MNDQRQLDPEALGDHIDRLYRAAWGLCGSREEAEDLVQETFERVLRRPRFLHSEDDLGYLLRVREATITTRLHRARQRVARDLVSEPAEPPNPPASQAGRA